MTRMRMLSPKLLADLSARRVTPDQVMDPTMRTLASRSLWVGPQDHASCRDYRLSQLLGFGLIDETELRQALERLDDKRILISTADAAAEMEPAHAAETAQTLEARARLAAIARLAESVGGDVAGLGTHAVAAAGGDLAARLASIQAELEALADALEAARAPYMAAQLADRGLTGARDLKIHLGAGGTKLDGWVNCDVFPNEVAMNLAWGLPFADGAVAFAYAGHVFEHLYYAAEALAFLREVKRVLRPGGVFRFIVPNVGLFLRKYAANDRAFFDHWKSNTVGAGARYFAVFDTPMELIMSYCMVGREPSEFFGHKMGYDFETLAKLGAQAGFAKVTESDYMASSHPELQVDKVSAAANLTYEGERYSLFVEYAT